LSDDARAFVGVQTGGMSASPVCERGSDHLNPAAALPHAGAAALWQVAALLTGTILVIATLRGIFGL